MKAISIRQPWAWMILHAGKDIENRDWATRYRGPVLIHAAKGMTRGEYEDCLGIALLPYGLALPEYSVLPREGIVGRAEIVDCATKHSSPWFFGRFGFVLRNVRPLAFQPCRGALGFFDPDPEAARRALAEQERR